MRALFIACLVIMWTSGTLANAPPENECVVPNDFDFANATVVVYEGLPHPDHEAELFAQELDKPVDWLHRHWFYAGAQTVDAANTASLRKVFWPHGGRLTRYLFPACEAFHPDYAMLWSSKGSPFTLEIQLCFGCSEARVYRSDAPKFKGRCTIGTGVASMFKRFQSKRPPLQED